MMIIDLFVEIRNYLIKGKLSSFEKVPDEPVYISITVVCILKKEEF